jgi:hypothetical protein
VCTILGKWLELAVAAFTLHTARPPLLYNARMRAALSVATREVARTAWAVLASSCANAREGAAEVGCAPACGARSPGAR